MYATLLDVFYIIGDMLRQQHVRKLLTNASFGTSDDFGLHPFGHGLQVAQYRHCRLFVTATRRNLAHHAVAVAVLGKVSMSFAAYAVAGFIDLSRLRLAVSVCPLRKSLALAGNDLRINRQRTRNGFLVDSSHVAISSYRE
ncbi:hypothetical protein [Aureliella helgolandensis]|uniref:hypothetical protein n=1 Tax=Aureliella helgolandensis TaxID=2527968 RepID=UPI001E64A779|nr:hypothetical protein [Aureliella helgolandensis]